MNIAKSIKKGNPGKINLEEYDHYISIDWSDDNASVGRMRSTGSEPIVKVFPSEVKSVKKYIGELAGKKILTIEETTTTHWLYVELKESVDKILVCDPYRNSLLGEGPKTDKIDARKLCLLLRSGLLKEVFHSLDEDYNIRKIVSAYEDVVKAGVRLKNQQSALYRANGINYKTGELPKEDPILKFISERQNKGIEEYENDKKSYEEIYKQIEKGNREIKNLDKIPGIGVIWSVTIYAIVIDAKRFENKYKFWAYCGLVKHDRESGGRSYGKKRVRYSRKLRCVFKGAALAAIGGQNDIRQYYEHLLKKGVGIKEAQNAIARYIAKVSYVMLKNKTEYRPYKWRENIIK
jgi:transposase